MLFVFCAPKNDRDVHFVPSFPFLYVIICFFRTSRTKAHVSSISTLKNNGKIASLLNHLCRHVPFRGCTVPPNCYYRSMHIVLFVDFTVPASRFALLLFRKPADVQSTINIECTSLSLFHSILLWKLNKKTQMKCEYPIMDSITWDPIIPCQCCDNDDDNDAYGIPYKSVHHRNCCSMWVHPPTGWMWI